MQEWFIGNYRKDGKGDDKHLTDPAIMRDSQVQCEVTVSIGIYLRFLARASNPYPCITTHYIELLCRCGSAETDILFSQRMHECNDDDRSAY